MNLKVKRLCPESKIPGYATEYASGMDICSIEEVVIPPGKSKVVSTGIAVEIPFGHEGQLRSRSGMSSLYQIILANGVGTIDADYRGEIKVPLINLGFSSYKIEVGDRIAQLVINHVSRVEIEETDSLVSSIRGVGGFGSTGK